MSNRPMIVLLHGVQSSRNTWWRLEQDLTDLGWEVRTLNLLGHGDRASAADDHPTIDDLARDVAAQVPGPVDLVVGHSLGAIVGLTLAGLQPEYCRGLVIEDPPGLAGELDPHQVAASVQASVNAARTDSAGAHAALLKDNPLWSSIDADHAVVGRQRLNDQQVTRMLHSADWDLQQLVRDCPVPLHLLAADSADSALGDPDRTAVTSALPAERVSIIDSGHSVHQDRPGLWLQHILRFADSVEIAAPSQTRTGVDQA